MTKSIEEQNKRLLEMQKTIQETFDAFKKAKKELKDMEENGTYQKALQQEKEFNNELAKIKKQKFDEDEKENEQKRTNAIKELELSKKGELKKKESLEKQMADQKSTYNTQKAHYTAVNKLVLEENQKLHAQELLKIDTSTEAGRQELANRVEINKEILDEQKGFTAQLTEMDNTINPKEAKATKEEADKAYKEKYNKIAKQTAEYTQTLSSSMTSVLGESTKFIDSQIAKYKEQMAELDKKIANTKREAEDAKKETQKALDAAKAKEMEGLDEDEKKTKTAELAELEEFYARQAELEDINKEREGLNMEDRAKLSDEEIARFDALKESHADYATSLETKSNADKEANKKVKDLEDEKEKFQDKIDKAEKKKKKIEFSKQIITASTNIAEGVTKALALGPIVGPIMASILGAAGAVQLALMMSNKNKFEDGGLLSGKRHSQGGMPILGSNIEVEGGEYVVNRQSTGKNLGLLGYINSQRRELGANDLNNYFSESPTSLRSMFQNELAHAGEVPQMEPQVSVSNAQLLEAIQGINFSPRVSVTDINTVHDNMVKVDEWTGL